MNDQLDEPTPVPPAEPGDVGPLVEDTNPDVANLPDEVQDGDASKEPEGVNP